MTVQDAGGNTVTSDASTATLSITPGTGTAGAALSGCTQSGETAGVISFSGCAINLSGNGYGLTATDGAMTTTSATFNVSTGGAAQLVFTQSPTASSSNTAFSQQPVVTVEDAGGNTVNTNTRPSRWPSPHSPAAARLSLVLHVEPEDHHRRGRHVQRVQDQRNEAVKRVRTPSRRLRPGWPRA